MLSRTLKAFNTIHFFKGCFCPEKNPKKKSGFFYELKMEKKYPKKYPEKNLRDPDIFRDIFRWTKL